MSNYSLPPASTISLPDFQHRYLGEVPAAGGLQAGQFVAYSRADFGQVALPYQRRDFYKLSLLTRGTSQLHQATRGWAITGPAVVLSHPLVPHAWETVSDEQSGLFCLFTAEFLHGGAAADQALAPLLALGRDPVYLLEPGQLPAFEGLFGQLLTELGTDYPHKAAVLRHYLHLLLHQLQRLSSPAPDFMHPTAADRLAALFLELLARQFPVALPDHPLRLRAPQDFAPLLGVHANYLNRSVRAVTGKTTTAHVAERRLQEARRLLRHTAWPLADIAEALGFAYPTHFHNFFKQHTGLTPQQARQPQAVVV
jgi:AraC-like DNA-binding protein